MIRTITAAVLAVSLMPGMAMAQDERALSLALEQAKSKFVSDATYVDLANRDRKRDSKLPTGFKIVAGLAYAAAHIPVPALFYADLLIIAAACADGPTAPATPYVPPPNPCPNGKDVTVLACSPYLLVAGKGDEGKNADWNGDDGKEGGQGRTGVKISIVLGRVKDEVTGATDVVAVINGVTHALGKDGKKIYVSSRGGPGGTGGKGADATTSYCPGKGGKGGRGGRGGTVEVFVTDPALAQLVVAAVPGGDPGKGGPGGKKHANAPSHCTPANTDGKTGDDGDKGPMGQVIFNTISASEASLASK